MLKRMVFWIMVMMLVTSLNAKELSSILVGSCIGGGEAIHTIFPKATYEGAKSMCINMAQKLSLKTEKFVGSDFNTCVNICLIKNGYKLKESIKIKTAEDYVNDYVSAVKSVHFPKVIENGMKLMSIKKGKNKNEVVLTYSVDAKIIGLNDASQLTKDMITSFGRMFKPITISNLKKDSTSIMLNMLKVGVVLRTIYKVDNNVILANYLITQKDI